MKIPKILAAMTIATLLNSGGIVAHAADPVDSSSVSKEGLLNVDVFADEFAADNPTKDAAIEVTGTFKKTITSFPDPTQNGRYLRVTMPIAMDFVYNADTDKMTAATATITNSSVYAENVTTPGSVTITPQPIRMKLADFKLNEDKTTLIDTSKIELVDKVNDANKDKIQLPFELRVNGGNININHNLKAVQKPSSGDNNIDPIKIDENGKVELNIGLIPGQKVSNTDLIKKGDSLTKHILTLQFEYNGQ